MRALRQNDFLHTTAEHHHTITCTKTQLIDPLQEPPSQTASAHQSRSSNDIGIQIHCPINKTISLQPLQQNTNECDKWRSCETDNHIMSRQYQATPCGGQIKQRKVNKAKNDSTFSKELHSHPKNFYAFVYLMPWKFSPTRSIEGPT